MDDALERQRQIEAKAKQQGEEKANQDLETEAGEGPSTILVMALAGKIGKSVRKMYAEKLDSERKTPGRGKFKKLAKLDAVRVCGTAMRAALQHLNKAHEPLDVVLSRVGRALEDQLIAQFVKSDRYIGEKVRRLRNGRVRLTYLRYAAGKGVRKVKDGRQQIEKWDAWSDQECKSVGGHFVGSLVGLNILEIVHDPKNKGRSVVKPTAFAQQRLGELSAITRQAATSNPPCTSEPVAWSSLEGGGYHFRSDHGLRPLKLVRRASRLQQVRLDYCPDLVPVMNAINSLQRVPWQINRRVLGVASRLFAEKSVPKIGDVDRPTRPSQIPSGADDSARKRHWWDQKDFDAKCAVFEAKRRAFELALRQAESFKDDKALYFVHHLDTRGRVYTLVDYLSPQGNDIERSLLEFAGGDPMTGDSERWLRIHLANCYGLDKESFSCRVQWTHNNENMILQCADNPSVYHDWKKADEGDKPWQFLAACFAYQEWTNAKERGEPYVCRLPVVLDATCSGIQHFAALMRDGLTGAAVNLTPQDDNERPRDLYGEIAEKARRLLSAPPQSLLNKWAEEDWREFDASELAIELAANHISRKVVKPAVMTLPYGAGEWSRRRAIIEKLEGDKQRTRREWEAFTILADAALEVMNDQIPMALEALEWIRKVAEQWRDAQKEAKKTIQFQWEAPSGFPAGLEYFKKEQHPVKVPIDGTNRYVRTWEETEKPDWDDMISGAAPNFIHSLDASLLVLSINTAVAAGITQLTAVHDAFGTTPAKIDQLARIVRTEFARLYSKNQFHRLVDAARSVGGFEPSSPPAATKAEALDIEAISAAKYLIS